MKLDILFLGKLFPRDIEAEIKAKMKTGMQDAANALQWNIIEGLDANDCGTVTILDYLPVDSYPKGYTDRKIQQHIFQHSDRYQSDDEVVACTNLTIVKQFANLSLFKKKVKKWVNRKLPDTRKVIMVYTAQPMGLSLVKYAKKLDHSILSCCVIADIPEFITASDLGFIHGLYNSYQAKKSASLYKYVDSFVLLTEQMAEKLRIKVPYTVMEGICPSLDEAGDTTWANRFEGKKYILYTGTLNYKFGIGELLDAFSLIPATDLQLVICGFGQAEERIKQDMKKDPRIHFLGRVDRLQVLPLQRGAKVLVNPRQNNEEYTKYSFPSKTMEYLASGVPVVAYRLDGIPDEYEEHIHYVENNSVEALRDMLIKVCEDADGTAAERAVRAAAFVKEQKNAQKQTLKILQLLELIQYNL